MKLENKIIAQLQQEWSLSLYLSFFPEITPEGQEYLKRACAAPSRNPSGNRSSWTRLASQKTKTTISSESNRAELPVILMAEASPEVIYYVEQPPKLSLIYGEGSHKTAGTTTPDLVLFFPDGPVLVECKTRKDAVTASVEHPQRFQFDRVSSEVRSKPSDEAAAQLGLRYEIYTEESIDPLFARNFLFLLPHYRGKLIEPITAEEESTVLQTVNAHPGVTFEEIPLTGARRADVLYQMIARGQIFTNLSDVDLKAQKTLPLYITPPLQRAFSLLRKTEKRTLPFNTKTAQTLGIGSQLRIDKSQYTVVTVRIDGVVLKDSRTGVCKEIPYSQLWEAKPRILCDSSVQTAEDVIRHLPEHLFRKHCRIFSSSRPISTERLHRENGT